MAAEDGLVICAVPAFLGRSGECMWSVHDLTYSVTTSLPGMSDEDWLQAIRTAWSYWEEVCDLHATYTEDAAEADVLIATGRIDGPSGVLAWSEMPCGAVDPEQLNQRYDTGEKQWVDSAHPQSGQLDIVRVLAHEIGHVIGIPHFGSGAPALLAPMYSTSIRRPQPMDIAAAVDRYGPPVSAPTPIPPTPIPPTPVPPDPIPPVHPPIPGVPPMTFLQLIQLILALLGQLNPGTPAPPPTPGAPVPGGGLLDFIRRLLAAFGAGKITAAQLHAAYQTLELHAVTEAEMNAPVEAMKLN